MLKGKKTWKTTKPEGNFGGKTKKIGKTAKKLSIWTAIAPSEPLKTVNPLKTPKGY